MNEDCLKLLADSCDGVFGTLLQAIEELGVPRLKSTRPVPSYKGQITLGSPLQFDTALCIDVERYPRVMIRRPLSASSYVQRIDELGKAPPGTDSDPTSLTSVRNTRTYKVADETAPGGIGDVNRDTLAKGYDYGRTVVPISQSDENVTKLETEAGLEVIGFIPWSSVRLSPAKTKVLVDNGPSVRTVHEHVCLFRNHRTKVEYESHHGTLVVDSRSL